MLNLSRLDEPVVPYSIKYCVGLHTVYTTVPLTDFTNHFSKEAEIDKGFVLGPSPFANLDLINQQDGNMT